MESASETLRKAIEQCGESRYSISKATGISASVLSRFVASGGQLRTENFDKLCEHLGLVLKPAKSKQSARKGERNR